MKSSTYTLTAKQWAAFLESILSKNNFRIGKRGARIWIMDVGE